VTSSTATTEASLGGALAVDASAQADKPITTTNGTNRMTTVSPRGPDQAISS
jgi:hypothetical protein